jgi:hypothetical protein
MGTVSTPISQRPPQVTFATGLVIAGSAFVLLGNFSRVGNLRSLENRALVEDLLAEPALQQLGLSIEDGFAVMYGSLVIGAVCAVASAILGGFAMKGSKPARIGLSVLALPLFVSGLFNGGFATALVAAAVTMLWLSPGREWFRDGVWTPPRPRSREDDRRPPTVQDRPPLDPPTHPGQHADPGKHADQRPSPYHQPPGGAYPFPGQTPPPPPAGTTPPGAAQPGITQPGTQQPGPFQPTAGPSPYAPGPQHAGPYPPAPQGPGPYQPGPHPGPYGPAPAHDRRPAALVWACAVAAVFAGFVGAVFAIAVLVVATNFDLLLEEVRRQSPQLLDQGVSEEALRQSTYVTGAVVVVWCLAALVLTVLTWLGRNWARILLTISSGVCAGLCAAMVLASPVAVIPAVAGIAVLVLLNRSEVRGWFARR